ncbi:MAG: SWIM zinc finger family protein, partial [Nitrososphaeraceae archaeon]
ATQSGWACSCPDYARYNAKCKHVYAIEFYRRQKLYILAVEARHLGSPARCSNLNSWQKYLAKLSYRLKAY